MNANKIEITHKIIREWFLEINHFRIIHGVKPLVYEERLEKSAQNIANTLSRLQVLELNDPRNYHYGEITGKIINSVNNITGTQLAATWYAKGDQYHYSLEEPVSETKAFTQMIWASSAEIGLGITINSIGDAYFVGHFHPKGNVSGQFIFNVFPSQSKFENLNRSIHEINRIAVERINYYRLKHNSPVLSITLDLIKSAQNRAKYLVHHQDTISSSPSSCNIGESVSLSYNPLESLKFEYIIDEWYNEGNNYDYLQESSDPQTNDFTQLVWKSTKEIGFGYAYFKGYYVFVAHYSPPGNVLGKFHEDISEIQQKQTRSSQPIIESNNNRIYYRLLS